MPRNPGREFTRRLRLAQMLMDQEQASPPIQSHTQGLASMLRQGLAGFMQGADARDRATAYQTMIQGLQAKPWVNPDTGQIAPGQPPTGGMAGAEAALSGLTGNEYAQQMLPDIMMQRIGREQALEDDVRRRDLNLQDYDAQKQIDQRYAPPKERKIIKGADGYQYYEDGSRVLPSVQKPQGGMFEGTGIEAQALNTVMAYEEKKRQGIATTPGEDRAYGLARQRLERPNTLMTPQGTYVVPGYNLGPADTTPPNQGFDKLSHKPSGEAGAQSPAPGFYPKQGTQDPKAKETLSATLGDMTQAYLKLRELGGVVDPNAGVWDNIGARISSSDLGQTVGSTFGTPESSIRKRILNSRPALINAIRQATGMSAKGMDSNVELQFFLQQATDPHGDILSNLAAIEALDRTYGLGNVLEQTLPPDVLKRVRTQTDLIMKNAPKAGSGLFTPDPESGMLMYTPKAPDPAQGYNKKPED